MLVVEGLALIGIERFPDARTDGFLFLVGEAALEATGGEILFLNLRRSGIAPGSDGDFALAALPGSVVVHRENLEEDFPVALRITRSGHEHAQDGSPDEDERLAPPPFPQPGERLAVVRPAFLVGFGGEAGDGELGLDEGG